MYDSESHEIEEGTWILPNTMGRVTELVELMQTPITPDEASDRMYSIYGNDTLLDEFLEAEKNGIEDVRPEIRVAIRNLIADYEKNPQTFKESFSDEVLEKLKEIAEDE